jgi:hypothetical protein
MLVKFARITIDVIVFLFLNASMASAVTATPPIVCGILRIGGFVPVIVVIVPVPAVNANV